MEQKKFYDLNPVLKKNKQWNMIFGVRGNGKTYGLKKHCIIDFLTQEKEFVWVRRTGVMTDICSKNWLKDIKNDKEINELLPNNYYLSTSENYIMLKPKNKLDDDDDVSETVIIGYFIPLSTAEKNKSSSYHNVFTVVFDEVLTFGTYLSNETIRFNDLLSSVERERKGVKIFLLSNNTTIDNPYFSALNLNMNVIKAGKITVFNKKGLIQICDKKSVELALEYQDTISYWFGSQTGYNEYSEKGEFIMDDTRNVEIIKLPKQFKYNVIINGIKIGVWEYKNINKKYTEPLLYFSKQTNPQGKTYTLMKNDFKGTGGEITIVNGSFAPYWKNEIHACNVKFQSLEIKKQIHMYIIAHIK